MITEKKGRFGGFVPRHERKAAARLQYPVGLAGSTLQIGREHQPVGVRDRIELRVIERQLLRPELPVFGEKHPQIELQILVGTRERDLACGEAELSIQSPRPRQQGLVAVQIAHVTAALYASKALIGGGRLWINSIEALRDLSLLLYASPYQMLQQAKWFQRILSSATIGLETNSTHTLLAAARAGNRHRRAPPLRRA